MSYANAESTLVTILKTVTGLGATLVTAGNYAVLDKGVTAAAVVWPGGFDSPEDNGQVIEMTHVCNIDLFQRFTDQTATHSAFVSLRDAVVVKLQEQYQRRDVANNPYGFYVTSISAGDDPQDVQMQNAPATGPVFRAQTLTVTLVEYVEIY